MRSWRWYSKVLFALLIAAFGYYVWPTPWTYYQLNPSVSAADGPYATSITEYGSWLRVNRFTGRAEELSGYRGWHGKRKR